MRIMNCRCASGGGHLPFPLKSSRPLPSRSARHPPPKWGWARKTWRRGAINPKLASPRSRGGGGPRLYLKSCLPPLAGGEEDHEVVEGGAPSGRCLRSGHKNSVKGKGAIKHKGVPTIIYHCTDAPFRLAPLATHPLSGGGQEKHGCPFPSRTARHPSPEAGMGR